MQQELNKPAEFVDPAPAEEVPKKTTSHFARELEGWVGSDVLAYKLKEDLILSIWADKTRHALSERMRQEILYIAQHGPASLKATPEYSLQTHPETETRAAKERQLAVVIRERDELSSQNQLLQSRVSEWRRTASRETQRFDQLQADHSALQQECSKLRETIDKLIDRLNERAKANDCLQSSLISGIEGRLRMTESYEGVVEEVDEDMVLVVYDVNGKIVEQTYEKNQFIDGRLPDVETRLVVFVNVAEVQSDPIESGAEETEPRDELAIDRRKPLTGTVEF